MHGEWLRDLDSLEAISQNETARRIFLRMAAMSEAGTMQSFVAQLASDQELDDETKAMFTELADNAGFLLAVEDYLRRTRTAH
jgi:hypothetical protein